MAEPADFSALMDEIEGEMRRRGQWEEVPPSPLALESRLPFCCDTLRFTQWLQWMFVPRTRALLEVGGPMPAVSGIRPMAEEALLGCDWETLRLVALLDRFDCLVNARSAAG